MENDVWFTFPEMTEDEYIRTLDMFNQDISKINQKSMPTRLASFVLFFMLEAFYCVFVFNVWVLVTKYTTARSVTDIIIGLIFDLFLLFAGIIFLSKSFKRIVKWLMKLLRMREFQESYTLSEYAERKDTLKYSSERRKFYNMCDLLKNSKILDCTLDCNDMICDIQIQYENSGAKHIMNFAMPYHESDSVVGTHVDFERECVIFQHIED